MKTLIVIGLVLVLLGSAYFLFTNRENLLQTSNDNDQKVYISDNYNFVVNLPEGWEIVNSEEQKDLEVQLKNKEKDIWLPIFIGKGNWDDEVEDFKSHFKPEMVENLSLSGQAAIITNPSVSDKVFGYNYRIKHGSMNDLFLKGTAGSKDNDNTQLSQELVEEVLNSIQFN